MPFSCCSGMASLSSLYCVCGHYYVTREVGSFNYVKLFNGWIVTFSCLFLGFDFLLLNSTWKVSDQERLNDLSVKYVCVGVCMLLGLDVIMGNCKQIICCRG